MTDVPEPMVEFKDPTIDMIKGLEETGVITVKSCDCPEPHYWQHWTVNEPEKLPELLKDNYENFGELRWYVGGLTV